MSTGDSRQKPQSWEHLLEKDPHGSTGFRLGILAAAVIHVGIFAITWPTVAQAPPDEPEEILYRVPIHDFVPTPPEPEPILAEVPVRPEGPPIIDGPAEVDEPEPVIVELPPPPGPEVVIVAPPPPPPPPPEAPPAVVMVNVDIDPPELVHKVEPIYTESARHVGLHGVVILELIIDTSGAVESVKVHRGLPLGLTESAVNAVKQWRFRPSVFNNRPVAVRYILTVRFNLN